MSGKLSAESCRAARALLEWSTRDLQREARVGPNTVAKLESGGKIGRLPEGRIIEAFERHGIELLNGSFPGARLKKV